jgi:phosphate/sulfate permease
MYGMLTALTAASIWLLIATYCYLAVSTTHSIIGAIMGFALVYGGADAVKWNDCKPDFPWTTGFLPVALSWFISPISSAILASIIFLLNRHLVLRRKNSTNIAFWVLPLLLLLTFFINLLFVLGKVRGSAHARRPAALPALHADSREGRTNTPVAWLSASHGPLRADRRAAARSLHASAGLEEGDGEAVAPGHQVVDALHGRRPQARRPPRPILQGLHRPLQRRRLDRRVVRRGHRCGWRGGGHPSDEAPLQQ